jgi:hypothetical protein
LVEVHGAGNIDWSDLWAAVAGVGVRVYHAGLKEGFSLEL